MEYPTIGNDFFINMDLLTTLALPSGRETILHFCEAVQKQFSQMSNFYQRDSGEYVLEGHRDGNSYPWMEIQSHRLSAGYFNPSSIEEAYELHLWLLDRVVYFLGIGGLDVEALDVMYGFNFDYVGNRGEVVYRALLEGSPMFALSGEPPCQAVEFDPNVVLSISEDCSRQARMSVDTRCNSYQVRTGNYDNEPISAYYTIRQYPQAGKVLKLLESFRSQCRDGEELLSSVVIPQVLEPIASAIAAAE